MVCRTHRWSILAFALAGLLAGSAAAQEVILDRPVRAGGLIFFPTVGDPNTYYYAPTRARLATGASGKPQFSFLRYVQNVTDAQQEVTEGEGGGIVHAVVELGISDEDLERARGELRRGRSGAQVAGPVVFRSGRFGLVTSFTAENGELTTRVVGLGTAPILEGSKAALSIQLTKLGAKVLHESFETTTPDISFMFEMEMKGYREPVRATITADLDRVYEHENFQLGVATTYVQAEISQAFDDLYEKKVIKVEQVGEDEKLEAMLQTAYSKLIDLIFQPNQQQAQQLANVGGGRKSALDRASELLDKRREETRQENTRRRQSREQMQAAALRAQLGRMAAPEPTPARPPVTGTPPPGTPPHGSGTPGADPETAASIEQRRASLAMYANWFDPAGAAAADPSLKELPLPEFAAVMTYEMKRSRQRGEYRVDLNKWTADTLPIRFDENIGDLRRYLADDSVFRDVNLEDPLYQQREITASLVGVQDTDFTRHLAFASLQVRKQHGNGEETLRDVRVDRKRFNDQGNNFKVVYGFKGDTDRKKWQEYEYRVMWGFNTGAVVEEAWQAGSFSSISLRPPFRHREVQLEAFDAEKLKQRGVRAILVQVFSKVGGDERTEQITLSPLKGELSKSLGFVQPADSVEYQYEIKWILGGNTTLSSGRQTTSQDVLFLDAMPEA
jgi:hypothetical protein